MKPALAPVSKKLAYFGWPPWNFNLPVKRWDESSTNFNEGDILTVCIAAICDTGMIVGAADTMMTAGDLKFEPARQPIPRIGKIINLTNSVVAMIAGDTSIQSEIISRLYQAIHKWIRDNPEVWLPAETAVRFYCSIYDQLKNEHAERDVLTPLGLTHHSFVSRQNEMTDNFIARITHDLSSYQLPVTQTIIAGVEPSLIDGRTISRLYIINGNSPSCYDTVRFASVGSGGRHASSHFMLSGHGSNSSLADTLFSVFTAKKKAEAAPGVGADTHMFVLGPGLGTFNWLNNEVQAELNDAFKAKIRAEKRAASKASLRIDHFLTEIVSKSVAPTPQTSQPDETKV